MFIALFVICAPYIGRLGLVWIFFHSKKIIQTEVLAIKKFNSIQLINFKKCLKDDNGFSVKCQALS